MILAAGEDFDKRYRDKHQHINTIEDFELEVKNMFPDRFKIPNDSWFHLEISSVWKHKHIQITIFKNHARFIEHGEILKEIYPVILKSLKKYFDEQ